MKKKIGLALVMFVALMVSAVSAETLQYKHNRLERQTWLNTLTDYFATIGKDKREKRKILKQRKIDRYNARRKVEQKALQEKVKKEADAKRQKMLGHILQK